MPTILLFRKDPYKVTFTAEVTNANGKKIILDRTCFFPQSGGQVGDKGEINGVKVTDTQKDKDLNVVHILDSEPIFKAGDSVIGTIDWERRYKIMRLHSASHIVYYVMQIIFGKDCETASSGLVDDKKDRSDYLFKEKLDREKISKVEERANKIIAMDYEIKTWGDHKNPNYRYWKIYPFKAMPCGGTHVKNTIEIGKIFLKRGKKPGKGKERIEIKLESPGSLAELNKRVYKKNS
ncbi:MAG: alanyl-tRNA editing protein [Candidatus Bathyarchaeota archaeon]|nr:MAG: alanyl-tRNA editing protein [Candidatus Bathyarchaeota archaeon]